LLKFLKLKILEFFLAKIDGFKELLNNLRVAVTLCILLIIPLTSGLVTRFDNNKIDTLFFIGIVIDMLLMFLASYFFRKIAKVTKEIKYTK
jgi:hypothetical protein